MRSLITRSRLTIGAESAIPFHNCRKATLIFFETKMKISLIMCLKIWLISPPLTVYCLMVQMRDVADLSATCEGKKSIKVTGSSGLKSITLLCCYKLWHSSEQYHVVTAHLSKYRWFNHCNLFISVIFKLHSCSKENHPSFAVTFMWFMYSVK